MLDVRLTLTELYISSRQVLYIFATPNSLSHLIFTMCLDIERFRSWYCVIAGFRVMIFKCPSLSNLSGHFENFVLTHVSATSCWSAKRATHALICAVKCFENGLKMAVAGCYSEPCIIIFFSIIGVCIAQNYQRVSFRSVTKKPKDWV